MTAIAFPHNILGTAVPIDGFSHQRQPAGDSTEMDSGLARFRVTNRNPLRTVTVGWHWTTAQIEYFNAWNEYRAAYGGAWFNIDLPLDGPLRTVLARFSPQPQPQRPWRRTRWSLVAELLVRDTNVITVDVFDVVEAYGLDSMQAMDFSVQPLSLAAFFDTWDDFAA